MNPFQKRRESLITLRSEHDIRRNREKRREAVVDLNKLFVICEHCQASYPKGELKSHDYICPLCGFHAKMPYAARLHLIMDAGELRELNKRLVGCDPLKFDGYPEKVERLQNKTSLTEAVVTVTGTIAGEKVVVGVMDSRFLMGSMGVAVGEKIARAFEYATQNRLPVIMFSASGGARMQEGIFSLMQMAKTAGAVNRHKQEGLLFISCLTHPTTGGVTASFASLGDIILAEPQALIGFAGPRVIEQTIQQTLPEGFQTSEYLLEHGFVDAIVPREQMRATLAQLLKLHRKRNMLKMNPGKQPLFKKRATSIKTAAERVRIARQQGRPNAKDYIAVLFDDFIELHGDRLCMEDRSIIGGIASFCGKSVTVIGECKGKTLAENVTRNFAMPNPEGYRKVQRLAREAERFRRPIITLIDTPGAYPGIEAEAHGQGEAIASCLELFSGLTVPVIAIIIGEGGSGGALALGVANTVIMLENSIYSILSPEGFASILWKDAGRSEEACEVMKLTAQDLHRFGIVDYVINEPEFGLKDHLDEIEQELKMLLYSELMRYEKMSLSAIQSHRYQKFREMGTFLKEEGVESYV